MNAKFYVCSCLRFDENKIAVSEFVLHKDGHGHAYQRHRFSLEGVFLLVKLHIDMGLEAVLPGPQNALYVMLSYVMLKPSTSSSTFRLQKTL